MRKELIKAMKGAEPDALQIIEGIITVGTAAGPLLNKAFDALNNFINSLGSKNPNSPKNVRLRLAALEVKDELQKEKNKRQDAINKMFAEALKVELPA